MKTKQMGYLLIGLGLFLLIVTSFAKGTVVAQLDAEIKHHADENIPCEPVGCPHDRKSQILPYFYTLYSLSGFVLMAGIWLALTESESEKKSKQNEQEQKRQAISGAILSALDEDERLVIQKIKEQDGITQNTLRLRADMSKSKLSAVLKQLEKKNLVKKVEKGKTNQIFLKRSI